MSVLANKGLGVLDDSLKFLKKSLIPEKGFKNTYDEVKTILKDGRKNASDTMKYRSNIKGMSNDGEDYIREGYEAAKNAAEAKLNQNMKSLGNVAKDYWNQGGTAGKVAKVGAAAGIAYTPRLLSGSANPFVNAQGETDIIGIPGI